MLTKIALDRAGKTYLDGKQVSRNRLGKYLALGRTLNPEPWIFLETEMGASCASVEEIRDEIEKHVNCADGYRCNEGIWAVWENMRSPPGTQIS